MLLICIRYIVKSDRADSLPDTKGKRILLRHWPGISTLENGDGNYELTPDGGNIVP